MALEKFRFATANHTFPSAGCTARNWQPWSPQLQNEVFADIQLHLQRSFTT